MGASAFRPPRVNCEQAVRNVRETLKATKRNKKRARSMIKMLKLAVRPKHAELLYAAGATDICVDILAEEPKGSPMRELSLVALLCLTLDPYVRRNLVESNRNNVLQTLFSTLRQERPSSSVKYAAIAVLHSLSRDDRNLPQFFVARDYVDIIMEALAYESEGSNTRKLACEIVLCLSELPVHRESLHRSFIEVAPRVLVGEVGSGSQVLELMLNILANLALEKSTHQDIIKERVIMECAISAMETKRHFGLQPRKAKLAAMRLFHNLALGTEATVIQLALMRKMVQGCADIIATDVKAPSEDDDCSLAAARILHLLSSYPSSRLELFSTRNLADTLFLHSGRNVYARMAFINITGAFDREDELNPERRALLVGCEDVDALIVQLVRTAYVESTLSRNRAANVESEYEHANSFGTAEFLQGDGTDDGENDEQACQQWEMCSLALLSLSVLLRRNQHLQRIGEDVLPLVLWALETALQKNDSRTVGFTLSCLRSLLKTLNNVQADAVFDLLSRVQQKVQPLWRSLRADAERLVTGLSSTRGNSFSRLQPVIDILECVLDGNQRGYTRSLDVPLSSLARLFLVITSDEKAEAEKTLIRLIPRALSKALNEKDAVAAKYAMDLFQEVVGSDEVGDPEWDLEKVKVSAAVREIMHGSQLKLVS